MAPHLRGDEDKGSPSQDGVNPVQYIESCCVGQEKIEGSAEALRVCHHPFYLFPPKKKL